MTETADPDVVVYGATLAGIMAALRLKLRGYTSLVLEPTGHVGGIVAGGLVKSDTPGVPAALAGLTQDRFFAGIGAEYAADGLDDPKAQYLFEPKVAERVAWRLLDEAGATVLLNARIHDAGDVEVRGGRIVAVRTDDGWRRAGFFVDASYEGDLMAAAGVPYAVGREPASQYGEAYAGFQPARAHRIRSFRPNTGFPVGPVPDSAPGDGDAKVQAYNFRGVLTRAADRLPFPKPDGYDPALYRHLGSLLTQRGIPGLSSIVTHTAALPHGKFQTNQALFIGFDLPGVNWDYPDGGWKRRDEIIAEQVRWHQGMLYFLANDPSLPESFRADARTFGLPPDEFTDSPHGAGFPHALYVREARRMVGEHVFTEHDTQRPNNTKPTAVCCWQYGLDCHIVQYYPEGDDTIVGEGSTTGSFVNAPADLYQLPAESLFPARGSVENLAVPVCFSASHVGILSPRMEPTYGMLGEAAGELAAQSLRTGRAVQDYDYASLAAALSERGSVLELPELEAAA
ncbi:FAD-dependent oxidoreductase [Jiangella anatolica]|uniref:Xanthan lyase n=1 Tax=Jiangella anatolica TaxID=2670374 RepID=A0A2W2B3W1_9ACTN|nr:FAD-dependent oxidoreductase [Jiangella anatolica]PZF82111.1 xanthan lyase [Jiangella anatolica]